MTAKDLGETVGVHLTCAIIGAAVHVSLLTWVDMGWWRPMLLVWAAYGFVKLCIDWGKP